ncbi:hypothetical protein Mgra_00003061 [Meloidogyne graminicola]|uniref:Uncharacterized protein n=1 Tax=Meloidogyne graminicola TaxID=189291 RepID=A0A8S9ZWV8_9BILA|nr:hypothetical protein Mgra_00003061 [Meloidogyne graminicola]
MKLILLNALLLVLICIVCSEIQYPTPAPSSSKIPSSSKAPSSSKLPPSSSKAPPSSKASSSSKTPRPTTPKYQ